MDSSRPSHLLLLLLSLSLIGLLACNALTAPFASGRPTATPAPTALPRPTAAPEAQPTNPPGTQPSTSEGELQFESGLTLGSLAEAEAALQAGTNTLESLANERYAEDELSQAGRTYTYTTTLARSLDLIWLNGWCTTTEALLRENYQHITLEFLVGDTPVDLEQFAVLEGQSASGLYCRAYYTVITSWPSGETRLTSRVTFAEPINDGLADYPAGTHEYVYDVSVR
ncbi:MAG: hypothetical protein ACRDH2_06855 [Anaerolineales bacterium]